MIYIEANSGAVKRVGRCDVHATEFDLEAEEYVPLPKVRVQSASNRLHQKGSMPVVKKPFPLFQYNRIMTQERFNG